MEESVFNQSPFNSSPASSTDSTPKKGRGKKLLFLVIVLLILGAIAFGAVTFLGSTQKAVPTPTPTIEVPTDTPTPTPDLSQTPTPTPKKAAATPTPTTAVKPTAKPTSDTTGGNATSLSIVVQNGNGEAGVAKKAADILTGLGYTVASTGNADNFDYATTEIHVSTAKASSLAKLKSDLSASYTIGTAAADYTGSADALVIVGKQ